MAASRRRRFWAWIALALLVAVPIGVVVLAVRTRGRLFGFGLISLICLGIVLATIWWAFTTHKVWKRRLNLLVAAAALVTLILNLVVFGLAEVGAVVGTVGAALLYPFAARRALAPDARAEADAASGTARPRKPWLVVNPRSGGGKGEKFGLAEAARADGVTVHVLEPGDDMVGLARQAVREGADAIGVAGGDGSLGRMAAVAVEHDIPFVCVPAGTRNHFALDLGLDRANPKTALAAFRGVERRVDIALLNGRVFLNNVSLGAYADVVSQPGYRERKFGTAHEVLPALLRGEQELLPISVTDPDGRSYADALVLLIANNAYELRPPELGVRARLDGGVLQVSLLRARTGAALFGVVRRGLSNTHADASWAQWTSPSVRIDSRLDPVPIGVDGEFTSVTPPVELTVQPGALRVLVPANLPPRQVALRPFSRPTMARVGAVATGHDGAAP